MVRAQCNMSVNHSCSWEVKIGRIHMPTTSKGISYLLRVEYSGVYSRYTGSILEYTGIYWSILEYTGGTLEVYWSTLEYTGSIMEVYWRYTGVYWRYTDSVAGFCHLAVL